MLNHVTPISLFFFFFFFFFFFCSRLRTCNLFVTREAEALAVTVYKFTRYWQTLFPSLISLRGFCGRKTQSFKTLFPQGVSVTSSTASMGKRSGAILICAFLFLGEIILIAFLNFDSLFVFLSRLLYLHGLPLTWWGFCCLCLI